MIEMTIIALCLCVITYLLVRLQRLSKITDVLLQQPGESKEKLDLIASYRRISKTAPWVWYIERDVIEWSDEVFEMLGYEPGSFEMDQEFYMSCVYPDDRPLVEKSLVRILESHTVGSIEHRIFTRKGGLLWVEQRAELFRDAAGKPDFVVGVCQDVTARKISELDFMEKKHTLRLILDNAPMRIWLQDNHGRLQFVNKVYCDALGMPEEKLLSVNHYAEIYPGEEEAMMGCMASDKVALTQEGPHRSYETLRFADGQLHDLEIIKVRLTNNEGVVSGLMGLSTDITQRKVAEENLKFLAHHDGLTGLYNRNYFVNQLRKTFAMAQRQNNHGALFFFDCDHFKSINDSLGHQIGDEILKEMGARLSRSIRQEDEVARLGGDEFVVMAVHIGEDERVAAERAQSIAEKLKDALLVPYEIAGQLHHLTPSVGVSLFPQEDQTADDVLKHADTAMYRAKDAGRNTIRFFMPSMQQEVEQRLRTQTELRQAITNDELELHYQPQINARTGVTGVEALIRWNHPERGMVFPGDFIDVAEESGLIIPMGEWVLQNGLMQLKKWQAEGLALGTLAINVSPKQFHQDSFVEYVKGLLKEMKMSGDLLELELTENILLDQTAETVSKIEALKEVGVLFSIDDFGTGYSSMAYLKQLPLDRLKIDKSFVSDITTNINDAHIVKTIIGMSHNLGLELIAEGVETEEEMKFLLENGCDDFQGYYFARPMPAMKVIEFCDAYRPVLTDA